MGQKVNPHGLRVGVIKNWDSRWFTSDEAFGDTLVSDYKIRKYLKNELQGAGVPKIEIERDSHRVRVFIHCAKPGMVIGKGGSEIEKYKAAITKMVDGKHVDINVVEVRQPAPIADVVMHYAENAKNSGLDGVVCSPLEAGKVHERCGEKFLTVTPGVRFADGDVGDQKRVMTPAEAKKIGSDYIVVGRPITAAEDPVAAYERCLAEFVD